MNSIGVDIASENSPTGFCVLEWQSPQVAVVKDLWVAKVKVNNLVALVNGARQNNDPVGIDAPFGFPLAFREAVIAMAQGAPPPTGDPLWRETEKIVRPVKQALSSVTSLITNTVSGRCFPLRYGLLGQLCSNDLIGYNTRVFEVYPAAALVSWGVAIAKTVDELSYKTKGALGERARERVLQQLRNHAPWLQINDSSHLKLLAERDDAIDALVSALVARVAGLSSRPTAPSGSVPLVNIIKTEGWIHVPPHGSLNGLPAAK